MSTSHIDFSKYPTQENGLVLQLSKNGNQKRPRPIQGIDSKVKRARITALPEMERSFGKEEAYPDQRTHPLQGNGSMPRFTKGRGKRLWLIQGSDRKVKRARITALPEMEKSFGEEEAYPDQRTQQSGWNESESSESFSTSQRQLRVLTFPRSQEDLLPFSYLRQEKYAALYQKFKNKLTKELVFHVLADFWGKGRVDKEEKVLEGTHSSTIYCFFSELTQEMSAGWSAIDSVTLKTLSQIYQKAFHFSTHLSQLSPENDAEFIRGEVIAPIKQLSTNASNNALFFPLGWSGLPIDLRFKRHDGHALLVYIQKYFEQGKEKFSLKILNTGGGSEYHGSHLMKNGEVKFPLYIEWNDLSLDQVTNEDLWKHLVEPVVVPIRFREERPYYDEHHLYQSLLSFLGDCSKRRAPIPIPLITGQRAGTCSKKSADVIARFFLKEKEYKQFKIESKLFTLLFLYSQLTHSIESDPVLWEMLTKGIEKLEGSLIKAFERNGFMTFPGHEETRNKVIGTVFDLSQKIEVLEHYIRQRNQIFGSSSGSLIPLERVTLKDDARLERSLLISETQRVGMGQFAQEGGGNFISARV